MIKSKHSKAPPPAAVPSKKIPEVASETPVKPNFMKELEDLRKRRMEAGGDLNSVSAQTASQAVATVDDVEKGESLPNKTKFNICKYFT